MKDFPPLRARQEALFAVTTTGEPPPHPHVAYVNQLPAERVVAATEADLTSDDFESDYFA